MPARHRRRLRRPICCRPPPSRPWPTSVSGGGRLENASRVRRGGGGAGLPRRPWERRRRADRDRRRDGSRPDPHRLARRRARPRRAAGQRVLAAALPCAVLGHGLPGGRTGRARVARPHDRRRHRRLARLAVHALALAQALAAPLGATLVLVHAYDPHIPLAVITTDGIAKELRRSRPQAAAQGASGASRTRAKRSRRSSSRGVPATCSSTPANGTARRCWWSAVAGWAASRS